MWTGLRVGRANACAAGTSAPSWADGLSVEPGRTETLVHPALEGTVARGQGCCPWRVEYASARMGAPRRTHQRRALALGREAAACDRLAACCRLPGRGRPGVGPFDPRGTARVGGLFGNDPLKECPPGWAQSETVARSFLRVARDPHCPPLSHCLAPRYNRPRLAQVVGVNAPSGVCAKLAVPVTYSGSSAVR